METGLLKKVWHLSSVVKRINLIVIFLLMIFLSLLELISIGIVIPYIDFISGNVNINNVLNSVGLSLNYSISKDNVTIYASVLILLVFIVKSIVAIFLKYKVVKFSHHVMLRHRGYFIDSYLKQNFSQFSKRNSSEYIHAIQTMTSHYSGSVLRPILMLAGEIVVAIVIVTYLIFMYKFQIIFLLFILLVVYFIYVSLTRSKVLNHGKGANQSLVNMINALNNAVKGYKEVKLYGVEKYYIKEVEKYAKSYAEHDTVPKVIGFVPRYVIEIIILSFIIINVAVAELLYGNIISVVPMLSVFALASIRLMPIFSLMMTTVNELNFLKDTVDRLYADFTHKEGHDKNKIIDSYEDFCNLSLVDVSFEYDNKKKILSGINLNIEKNTIVGIIGKSGSGKSTLVDIILGFQSPTKGEVLINNYHHNVFSYMSKKAAYIPQSIAINDDSIVNNITYGIDRNTIDLKRVDLALDSAKMKEFVDSLDEGVNTKIGENGAMLSGGQKQRLVLARAFYHDREVIVFDESTSALDHDTELEISNEIRSLKRNKTILIITHNSNLLESCDKVYEIQSGKVVEVDLILGQEATK